MRVLLTVLMAVALTVEVAWAQQTQTPAQAPTTTDEAQAPAVDNDPLNWDSTVPGATLPPDIRARLDPRINAVKARGHSFQAAGAPTLAQTVAPGDVILAVPIRHARGGVLETDLVQQGPFGGPSRVLLHANTPVFHVDLPTPETAETGIPQMLSLWCGAVHRERDWDTYCLDGSRHVYHSTEGEAYAPRRIALLFNVRGAPPSVRETEWEQSGLPALEIVTIFNGWGEGRANVRRGFRIDGETLDVHDTYYRRRENGDSLMRFSGGLVTVHTSGEGGTVQVMHAVQPYDPEEEANLTLRAAELILRIRAGLKR